MAEIEGLRPAGTFVGVPGFGTVHQSTFGRTLQGNSDELPFECTVIEGSSGTECQGNYGDSAPNRQLCAKTQYDLSDGSIESTVTVMSP